MDNKTGRKFSRETEKRLEEQDPRYYSLEEVMKLHGVTEEMLEKIDEEEIEFE